MTEAVRLQRSANSLLVKKNGKVKFGMMTILVTLAILGVVAGNPFGITETAADSHQCVRLAVLSIEPYSQTSGDDNEPIGGWFPIACRHGVTFTKTGRPADVDINGRQLAGKEDFTEICGFGIDLGEKVGGWISNVHLNNAPTHGEDQICLALHPIGLYCGTRANMAEVMNFRMVKGEIPAAVNKEHCPDR